MKNEKRNILIGAFFALAVSGLAATSSRADTVIFSGFDLVSTQAGGFDQFTLPSFDTSLGSLTAVKVSFISALTLHVDVQNNTASALETGFLAHASDVITGPGGLLGNSEIASAATTIPSQFTAHVGDPPSSQSFSTASFTGVDHFFVDPSNFANYETVGQGTVIFNHSVGADASLLDLNTGAETSIPNVIVSANSQAGDQVSVRYDFLASAPVPEPTTWTLMIGGFGLGGAALRKRRAAIAV